MFSCGLLSRDALRLFCQMALLAVITLGLVFVGRADVFAANAVEQSCPEPPANGYQPFPNELRGLFDSTGTDRLGNDGPDLPKIWSGYPPTQAKLVSPYAPCILLKAMAYNESVGWYQFEADYGEEGQTFISDDCGYGIMQITSDMGGGGGFEPGRVAAEPAYNIGTGALFLIAKWNQLAHYIGNNNPYVVEDWYYAVWAYNGGLQPNGTLSWAGNPNNTDYLWPREPWECWQGGQIPADWPYQEKYGDVQPIRRDHSSGAQYPQPCLIVLL